MFSCFPRARQHCPELETLRTSEQTIFQCLFGPYFSHPLLLLFQTRQFIHRLLWHGKTADTSNLFILFEAKKLSILANKSKGLQERDFF